MDELIKGEITDEDYKEMYNYEDEEIEFLKECL